MAYLSGFDWDVFISYAQADNQQSGRYRRWITLFNDRLRKEIQKYLKGELAVFFAERDQKAYRTIQNIFKEIEGSAIFLVIGSPNWVRSEDWCQAELKWFLKHHPDPSRVFVAEFEPPEGDMSYPDELPDNLRREFWKYRSMEVAMPLIPGDALFTETLKRLAKEIRERFTLLKTRPVDDDREEDEEKQNYKPEGSTLAPVASPKPEIPLSKKVYLGKRVFVAHGSPEVEVERSETIAYLSGFGITIVEPHIPESRSSVEFAKSVENGLRGADAYVQLFGRRKVEPLDGSAESPTYLQLRAARAAGLTDDDIFLWLPDDIAPEKMSDTEYGRCLGRARNGSHVPDLTQAVLARLETTIVPPPDPNAPLSLVINADPEDRAQARELIQACAGRRCRVILDKFSLNELARKEWLNADAVAYVHGKSPDEWLAARYHEFNKERANKGLGEPKGQVIIYAPPPPKEIGDVGGGDHLKELDLSKEWSVEPFKAWLDDIGVPLTIKP
ncbi:MAG: hypothetical protein QOG72_1677 [Sphingomonadales bacterium]|jgi:hypothetical protein|nr:hypothetical protein [Sphingomonadales bacterium]